MDQVADAPSANAAEGGKFEFTGSWTEFLPIALTNFLLTIVTLGIYRFWAAARERRYLWGRTHFIDDALEWTGTGLEMFLGFVTVMVILVPAILIVSFGAQGFMLRGEVALAIATFLLFYAGLFYIINVALFRALRYRLSRTYWHGIRGGSDDGGWEYGWSGTWKQALALPSLGLTVPWAMTSLWNERWNRMSFGPYAFVADAHSSGLYLRWLMIYAGVFVGSIVLTVAMVAGGVAGNALGGEQGMALGFGGAAVVALIFFYIGIPLLMLAYYAAFYRQVGSATSLGNLRFEFTARTMDWLILFVTNILLVIFTLGVGLLFLSYRNWKFRVSHLVAHGHVDLDELTQSATRAPGEAEGLADMFDMGAI